MTKEKKTVEKTASLEERLAFYEDLFKYSFIYTGKSDWYERWIKLLRGLGEPVLEILIEFFQIYHSDVIKNSLMSFPNNADAMNQRNGSIITIGDIIKILNSLKNNKNFDMEFRDNGELRSKLNDLNGFINN